MLEQPNTLNLIKKNISAGSDKFDIGVFSGNGDLYALNSNECHKI
jgi:hypothetical protein